MRRHLFSLLALLAVGSLSAQERELSWYNPLDAEVGSVIQNQGYKAEIGKSYVRLPDRAKGVIRDAVWGLSRHSSGLAIYFVTNSTHIEVKYNTTNSSYSMPHMPSTGVSGLDLYRSNPEQGWDFCSGKYSFGKEQVVYRYANLDIDGEGVEREYRLYLPLYNGVKHLEIGVEQGAKLEFIPSRAQKPIVVYGTSITQGGCASRPSMAWCSIVQRALDCPLVNLGFSGNGLMEREMMELISDIDARMFVFDCLPNMSGLKDVEQRVYDGVKLIRQRYDVPILLIEHVGYANSDTYAEYRERVAKVNAAARRAYERLKSEGVKALYYMPREEIGCSKESTVDYVHLTDLGMTQQAASVEKKIRKILRLKKR